MTQPADTPKSSSKPPAKSVAKKLVVIDGKSVFYRGYYAMSNLATKDGIPTGGVYGFATMALEVVRRLKPDYVAVAWDKPKTNIRRRLELYPQYKAGRKPAPADFKAQIPILHELLAAFGWPLYELDDYEADDIMGALACQATEQGIETLLITSDMDMLQLVNDSVHVFALKTGLSNIELYSPASFTAKYGIDVDQFLDLKALKGDSSDNIPGVPGIGEKGALELLKQYKTLDGVYENLGLLKDTMRKKLEAGKDLAYLSKELARIWTDAPVPLNLKALDGSKADAGAILELLQRLEFRTLARQLPEVMQVAIGDHHAASGSGSGAGNLNVGKLVAVTSDESLADVHLHNSKDQPAQLLIHSRAAGRGGADPQLLLISSDAKTIYTLDLTKISAKAVVAWFMANAAPLVGYDVKHSLKVLLELAKSAHLPEKDKTDLFDMFVVEHDVLVGAFLLNALRREQSLTDLATVDINYDGSSLEDIDTEELASRGAEVIAIINLLHNQQAKDLLGIPKLAELAKTVEWPGIPVLAHMEHVGMLLDTKYLAAFSEEITDLISDYEQQIYGYADQEFNIASPSQLADILFTKMALPTKGIKKGKTGYSTAAAELDKLRGQHPIIDLVTQFREVAKLKNTYVDTLPLLVDSESRVHTTFNLTIAQTGRLSSTDPNLQNIPTRTDLGRRIRTAFVAGPGNKLISADYSQFELRLAAVLASDDGLIQLFNRGADIHTETAAQVYDRDPEDVTKQMRRAAKVINFGILYGMSPHGLSIATGMTIEQAAEFIKRYKDLRRPLFDYMDSLIIQARTDGYVQTLHGRRRPMPDINASNFIVRQAAERAAINMPIQGTEADLMKLAMIEVDKNLRADFPGSNQLLQVHDSILVEAPSEQAEAVANMLQNTMQNIYKLPVKLDVDVTIDDNWGAL